MQIGVNYLKEVEELYKEGKIDFVDYFKLYSLNEDMSGLNWCLENRWVMFHGIVGKLSVFGDADLIENTDIAKTKEILELAKSPYISAHISSHNNYQTKEETINAIKNNAREFKRIFNMNVALENIPYRERYGHCEYLLEPEIIKEVVQESDALFLFDISHARKSAEHFNMTIEEYISKLPMDRVVEFHLAGMYDYPDISKDEIRALYTPKQIEFIKKGIEKNGKRVDNHGKMNEEDYLFLQESLKKYPTLQYITLEYGSVQYKDFEEQDMTYPICSFKKVNPIVKDEVLEQLTRINEIVRKNNIEI